MTRSMLLEARGGIRLVCACEQAGGAVVLMKVVDSPFVFFLVLSCGTFLSGKACRDCSLDLLRFRFC